MVNFTPKLKALRPSKMHKSYKNPIKKKYLIKYDFGVIAVSSSIVTYRQLECLRRFIHRRVLKRIKPLVRVQLTHSMYSKPSKSRMGKGKGKFNKWFGYIYAGMLLFEFELLNDVHYCELKKMLKCINTKLSFNIKVVRNKQFRFSNKLVNTGA